MGKMVLPKHSSEKSDFIEALRIYYNNPGWVDNTFFVSELKKAIGEGQYSSSYNKKAQLPKYYGFVITENLKERSPRQKITSLGKILYEAIQDDNQEKINEAFMVSLETVQFGKNNYGSPKSDSKVEAPNVAMHAIKDLDYITYKELAFLNQNLDEEIMSYDSCIEKIKDARINDNLNYEAPDTYADNKPLRILVNLGLLIVDENNSRGNIKAITFSKEFSDKFASDISDLKIYNEKENIFVINEEDETQEDEDIPNPSSSDFDFVERNQAGRNVLLYGVPGAGKSYTIEHEYMDKYAPRERLVFHPDYTYSDFVGQILPVVNEDAEGNKNVSYEFTPGPFTTLLKDAYTNPMVEHFLVIEEINRGNAPAIFGEIFQLLDRSSQTISDGKGNDFPIGTSEYEISNKDIAKIVYGDEKHKVRIPSNMTIIGTMNTSDQNVFTLDTAFQRRWNMRLIENTFKDDDSELANATILDTTVTWEKFCISINEIILDKNARMTSSEDKRLGTHFVNINDLKPKSSDEQNNRLFPEKVIKYLWDDAFKFTREEIFDVATYNSLEKVIRAFVDSTGNERFKFFVASVRNTLTGESQSVETPTPDV